MRENTTPRLVVSFLVLVLLLPTILSVYASTTEEDLGSKRSEVNSLSTKTTSILEGNSEKKGDSGKANVVKHRVTSNELVDLKKSVGVYSEGKNYSESVNGHGTGLRPPTEEEWKRIGKDLYSVDQVIFEAGSIPVSIDHSKSLWFPPIGNQGAQGSCTAWSVGYYTKTFQEAKEHGWTVSQGPSDRLMSPSFIYNLINGGVDEGSYFADAIQVVSFIGECSMAKMPYNAADYSGWPSEQAWSEAPLYRANDSGINYLWVRTDADLSNLKKWLASGNLAMIGVDAGKIQDPFWGWSLLTQNDMLTLDNYANPVPNHAQTVVGYDDNFAYVEQGQTHYGAFKIANSWGIGLPIIGWEHVLDGCYWVSYETMKQRIEYCMFYSDKVNYQPELLASFTIDHQKRNECNIQVGLGNASNPIATKSFSQYIDGGSLPFPKNRIKLDISEFMNYIPNVFNQTFFLGVLDGGTSTIGNVNEFIVWQQRSTEVPCQTVNQKAVNINITMPPFAQILVNSRIGPSTQNQTVAVGGTVNLYFGGVTFSGSQFYLLFSQDGLSQVSVGDLRYTPLFNVATLFNLATTQVPADPNFPGQWTIGFGWVNGSIPMYTVLGNYFVKAFYGSTTSIPATDTSITTISPKGYILINTTTAPSPIDTIVQPGGNISLYFGNAVFSGSQFFLYMSKNGIPRITAGDTRYTPIINVVDLRNIAVKSYSDNTLYPGKWSVGNNWVNGTIKQEIADGNYFIKCFDGSSITSVTDSHFTVAPPPIITLTGATVISGGTGYTTPAVLLVGGGGTGATATARVSNGVILGVVLTNPGAGYTSTPSVVFRDPSPRAKKAAATVTSSTP